MKKETGTRLQIEAISKRIQEADPLNADDFMIHTLPILNNSGNVDGIVVASTSIIPETNKVEKMDYFQLQASLRDLGMIGSSIQRHGVDIRMVPNLEHTMIIIGSRLDETPRETVFHYGPWNPSGERQRTFTGTEGERTFIHSFREGMSGLDETINNLLSLQQKSTSDLNFVHTLDLANNGFQKMVVAMTEVRRKITPDFFSFQMRPYFPVLNISGQDYQAPGGAQMPVLLVDRILWGVDQKDEVYQNYYKDAIRYLPMAYREVAQSIESESLVTKVLTSQSTVSSESIKQSLTSILTSLLMFRHPHLKTAKDNFAKRAEGSKGSGGYTPDILEKLIELTAESKMKVEAM